MLSCKLTGGLGNQLFQIFTTMNYAIKYNHDFTFLNSKQLGESDITVRYTYWNNFLSYLSIFLTDNLDEYRVIYSVAPFHFCEIPSESFVIEKYGLIEGYFQSYKYFIENYDKIYNIIRIDEFKLNILFENHFPIEYFQKCVTLHFRIGDYISKQDYHPLLPIEYYINALKYILNRKKILFVLCFYEKNDDIDPFIKILKNTFPNLFFDKINTDIEDWKQMLLMSLCYFNVIANSTFSWWAAFLNKHSNKIICYPSLWFGPQLQHHILDDLFPDDWIKIDI